MYVPILRDVCACSTLPVQLLHDEPFEALRPTLETILADKDKNKQRGAAELLAGIVCGAYCIVKGAGPVTD